MLQPQRYPEMLGKALVFEAEPFINMVDDDNPWAEGLFMVVSMGALIGLAQIVGLLFTAAITPDSEAMLTALLQIWRQFAALTGSTGAQVESWVREWWPVGNGIFGYGWSWGHFAWLVLAPLALTLQWLAYGLVAHGVARALGGTGKLTQTLGAVALMVAPQAFVLLKVIPFVSVSTLMLSVWALLIVYRAIEVAHDLSWTKSAGAALATPALVLLLLMMGATAFAVVAAIAGGIA